MSFIIAIKNKHMDELSLIGETKFKTVAERVMLQLYKKYSLDTSTVIEVNPKGRIAEERYNVICRIERNCKHPNIQFTMDGLRICEDCGIRINPYDIGVMMEEIKGLEEEELLVSKAEKGMF